MQWKETQQKKTAYAWVKDGEKLVKTSEAKRAHMHATSTRRTTHTHTHPFNSPFSGTTRVSWYQKGKTNLDFTEARDSEWQWHHLGHMQVCT